MKKIITILLAVLMLSACTGKKPNGPTVKEILSKTQEANKSNFSAEFESSSEFIFNDVGNKIFSKGEIDNKKNLHVNSNLESSGQKSEMEMYVYDGVIYINIFGVWVKTTNQNSLPSILNNFDSKNLTQTLDVFVDKASYETKDGKHHVSIKNLTKEDILKLTEILFKDSLGPNPGDLDKVNIEKMDINYVIDAETYFIDSLDINMKISSDNETLEIKTSAKYKNFNNVKEIVLPEEAKNAIEAPQQ